MPLVPDVSQAISAMSSLRRDDKDHDAIADKLSIRGAIDTREAFIDASFAPAKKGTQSRKNETRKRDKDHGGR
jgi:hypothetical protein